MSNDKKNPVLTILDGLQHLETYLLQTRALHEAAVYSQPPEFPIIKAFVNPTFESDRNSYAHRKEEAERLVNTAKNGNERELRLRGYRGLHWTMPQQYISLPRVVLREMMHESIEDEAFEKSIGRLIDAGIIEDGIDKLKLSDRGRLVCRVYGFWYDLMCLDPPKDVSKEKVEDWKRALSPFRQALF